MKYCVRIILRKAQIKSDFVNDYLLACSEEVKQRNNYFSRTGKHLGSFISTRYMHVSLWEKQYALSVERKSILAVRIIRGKLKNQINLIKYFHKYHKGVSNALIDRYGEIMPVFKRILSDLKQLEGHEDYVVRLVDIIELFRTQAVDRVVISLIQKKEPLKLHEGLLDKDTKRLLMQNIAERLNRYEKYRNKECRLCDIINYQIKEIAEYIDNGAKFRPYIAKW